MSAPLDLRSFAASIEGRWGENDHRTITDVDRGFFFLVDGRGPTYGGYHAPIAMDSGLTALVSALERSANVDDDHLTAALMATHQHMHALARAHDEVVQRISHRVKDPLEAALLAADEVRPEDVEERCGRALVHFAAQLTACWFCTPDALVVGQVGNSRAYRHRDDTIDLLLPDHSIETMMIAQGESPDDARMHRAVVTSCLGVGEPRIDTAALTYQPGDRYLLCSQSIWADDLGASRIQDLLRANSQQRLDAIVATIAKPRNADFSAIVIQVEH